MRWLKRSGAEQPLSRRAFAATRVLGFVMLAVSIVCVVGAWVYWQDLSWPWRVALDAMPILFLASWRDIRQIFISYAGYRREWEESAHKKPP